ncbi:MAG TPA: hypothetical protein VNM48_00835, partial [Chloroflexota bacterium]|nr:hypothetical protein [Chloroflexota bacterium]
GVGACRGRRSFPGGAYPGFPMQGPMGFPGQVPFAGSPYGGSLYGAGMGAYGTPYATPIQSGFGVLPQQQRRQIAIQDGNTRISVGSGKARKGNGKASGRKVAARSAAARTSNRAQARAAQQQQPVMFPGMNPALAAGMRPGMGGMPGQGMLAAQQGVLGMQRQPMVIAPNAMGSGMAGYRPVASFSVPTLPFNGPGLDQPLIQGLQNLPD